MSRYVFKFKVSEDLSKTLALLSYLGIAYKENPELQYHAAWSNECIEFWFLLHFAYYTANNHWTEYISFLNDKFRDLGIAKIVIGIKK